MRRTICTVLAMFNAFLAATWFAGVPGQGPAVVIAYASLGCLCTLFALVALWLAMDNT